MAFMSVILMNLLFPIILPFEMIRYLITDPAMFWKLVNVIVVAFKEWAIALPQTIGEFVELILEGISMLH